MGILLLKICLSCMSIISESLYLFINISSKALSPEKYFLAIGIQRTSYLGLHMYLTKMKDARPTRDSSL